MTSQSQQTANTTEPLDEGPGHPEDEYAYLAVFGDIHGRVALMMTLACAWQHHEGKPLHAVLQVGDMGAYPDHDKLDRATLRHGKRDRDELSFRNFCTTTEECVTYLRRSGPDVFFIRGNHEDFDYLGQFQRVTAIDPFQRIHYVPDGCVVDLPVDYVTEKADGKVEWKRAPLRVAGYGGVHPVEKERGRGKRARHEHRSAARRALAPKYFRPEEMKRAFQREDDIDLLLSHAGPLCDGLDTGSESLAALEERVSPAFHFFGHHHVVLGPTPGKGSGQIVGLEHLDFERTGLLRDAAWGILRFHIPSRTFSFDFATHGVFPWMRDYQRMTYRNLWSRVSSD